jgi:glycerophosphoryl diester phosphodiesterase
MAAVELAWQQNADAVEVDVHLSKDKNIVVVHDRSAKRTGGLNKKISELNLHELKELDFGSWKGAGWSGEKIPLLRDVMESVPEGKRLFVEVKCGTEIIEPLEDLLSQNIIPSKNIFIMHFNLHTLLRIKTKLPLYDILWLYEFFPFSMSYQKRKILSTVKDHAKKHDLTGINIENKPKFDKEFIQRCRENNLKTYCWVVNDAARAKYLLDSGIDGITTDRPGWLKSELRKFEN